MGRKGRDISRVWYIRCAKSGHKGRPDERVSFDSQQRLFLPPVTLTSDIDAVHEIRIYRGSVKLTASHPAADHRALVYYSLRVQQVSTGKFWSPRKKAATCAGNRANEKTSGDF